MSKRKLIDYTPDELKELIKSALAEVDDVETPRFAVSTMYDEVTCARAESQAELIRDLCKNDSLDMILAVMEYLRQANIPPADLEVIFTIIWIVHELTIQQVAENAVMIAMEEIDGSSSDSDWASSHKLPTKKFIQVDFSQHNKTGKDDL